VTIAFPAPYGPGLMLLDVLPILPRHALEPAFKAGKFRDAWGLGTPPKDIVPKQSGDTCTPVEPTVV
jgi:hypothetical protein